VALAVSDVATDGLIPNEDASADTGDPPLSMLVADETIEGLIPNEDASADTGDPPLSTLVAAETMAGLIPNAEAPAETIDGLLNTLVIDEVIDGLTPKEDATEDTRLFVLSELSDGKLLVNEGKLKSETLGILSNIEPGLKASNQLASPAKLPAISNPPSDDTSKLGISKDVKELTSRNSVPKSVTSDPISGAKSRTSLSPMSTIASNPPLIL
jgi:hypothetical protein